MTSASEIDSTRADTDASRVAVGLAAGLTACVFAFVPSVPRRPEAFIDPKELALHVGALASLALAIRRLRARPMDVADGAVVGALALAIVSALARAENAWLAWRSLGLSASGALLFWSARSIAGTPAAARLLLGIGLIAGAAALAAVLEAYGVTPSLSQAGRGPAGPMGNRNQLAHALVLALPVLWRGVAVADRRAVLGAVLAATVVSAMAITLSRSRAAWLVGGVTVLALVVSTLLEPRQRRWRARIATFTAGVALGIALTSLGPPPIGWRSETPYSDTMRGLADYRTGSGRGRLIQYATTMRLIRAAPVFGVGAGNWSIAYARRASPDDPSYRPLAVTPTSRLPRADWLGIAAERGVPAALLLASTGALLLISAWRDPRRPWADGVALVTLIVALLLLGCLDAVFLTPLGTAWAATVCGLLAPVRPGRGRPHPGARSGLLAAAAVIGAVAGTHALRRVRAERLMTARPTLAMVTRAATIDPSNYEFQVVLATHWVRERDCDRARPYIERADRLFPGAYPPRILTLRCASRYGRGRGPGDPSAGPPLPSVRAP